MCVIIHKPKDGKLSKGQLELCGTKNRDGIGMAWFVDGERGGYIHVEKGVSIERVWEAVQAATYYDIVIHFRLATHGPRSVAMMHPFGIGTRTKEVLDPHRSKTAVFHNGIISGFGSAKLSDTAHFCGTVLPYITDRGTRRALLDMTGDRFLVLHIDKHGKGRIDKIGKWECIDGTAFSNTNWKPYQATYCGSYRGDQGRFSSSKPIRTLDPVTREWVDGEWDFEKRRIVAPHDNRIITLPEPKIQVVPSDVVSDDPNVVNDAIERDLLIPSAHRQAITEKFKGCGIAILEDAISRRKAQAAGLDTSVSSNLLISRQLEREIETLEGLLTVAINKAATLGESVASER